MRKYDEIDLTIITLGIAVGIFNIYAINKAITTIFGV